MTVPSTVTDAPRRPSVPFALVLLLLAAALAHVGLSALDQGLRAARGEGAPGVFTAADLTCVRHPGHTSCACHGSFVPDSGGAPRSVDLHAAGAGTCLVGEPVPATDAGAAHRVYGPDGSREWLFALALLGISLAAPVGQALLWTRWLRGRSRPTPAGRPPPR
ncbi:hypothetical protein [Nocardiopsis eucommiae]|uniref:hypothetical protein n=1 Tax=Nocardiopsis eucommiae TaxID=2831970 RepID=UPI003D711AE6